METWRTQRLLLCTALIVSSVATSLWAQRRASPVVTFTAIRREAAAGHTFIGTSRPIRKATVGSAVDGRVVSIKVEEGDFVRHGPLAKAGKTSKPMGQVLIQLRTKAISILLRASKAELELRKQEFNELMKGALEEEKTQAKAKLAIAKSAQALAQLQFKRIQKLYDNGRTTTLDMLDRARAQSLTANQMLVDAKAAHDLVLKGPRIEKKEQARARMASQQAEVDRIADQLQRYTIRAPFSGYVTQKLTEVGAWISRGDAVVEVVSLDPIEIDVAVPERYITHLRRGVQTQIRLDAISGKVFTGTVHRIVPQARIQSRTFPVRIRVKNPRLADGTHLIKAGMLVHATLAVGRKASVVLVPKDALVLGGRRPKIFIVGKDGKVFPQDVTLGIAVDSMIEVRGQLQPGQKVVVQGNERLRPGQVVSIVGEMGPDGKKRAVTKR